MADRHSDKTDNYERAKQPILIGAVMTTYCFFYNQSIFILFQLGS
jgi:hypothetical protein